MRISIIGLGKLGAPLAACFAARGNQVIGVDANERIVQSIVAGQPPVPEPGLAELLTQAAGRLSATVDLTNAVRETDISFVIVPTPSQPDGAFSLRYVLEAVRGIGAALRAKDSYHVVVITSTVMPGDTGGPIRQALETASGKLCGRDFGLCYSPEFIALGSVIHDLQNPDFVLIGESDARAGDLAAEAVLSLCTNQPSVQRMAFVNAELAKIAVNTFVTTKIAFANMLGQLCEQLDDGDVDAVARAVGSDRRIGSRYLKAGLGYGGPCFPRDNRALVALARQLGVRAPIPLATDRGNTLQLQRLEQLVRLYLPAGGAVGILGVTYKPDTPVTEEAQGLALAQSLASVGIPVVIFDPLLKAGSLPLPGISWAKSMRDCMRQADVLVIANPCREFREVEKYRREPQEFHSLTIIDCWRLLDPRGLAEETQYIGLGRCTGSISTKGRTRVQRPRVRAR